jgi:hypothetical protein
MTLSQELRGLIRATYPIADESADRMFSGRDLREIYPLYLIMLHQIVRSSVPLMQAALDRLVRMERKNRSHDDYAKYLEDHIKEEAEHDEWLLADLALIGHDKLDVLGARPSHEVAQLVGAQYYWTFHDNPFSLLGYIAVLEGAPPSTSKIDRMETETGYPADAFRTLRIHSDVDQDHLLELDSFLDRLLLAQEDRHSILANSAFTVLAVSRCIAGLVESHDTQRITSQRSSRELERLVY